MPSPPWQPCSAAAGLGDQRRGGAEAVWKRPGTAGRPGLPRRTVPGKGFRTLPDTPDRGVQWASQTSHSDVGRSFPAWARLTSLGVQQREEREKSPASWPCLSPLRSTSFGTPRPATCPGGRPGQGESLPQHRESDAGCLWTGRPSGSPVGQPVAVKGPPQAPPPGLAALPHRKASVLRAKSKGGVLLPRGILLGADPCVLGGDAAFLPPFCYSGFPEVLGW